MTEDLRYKQIVMARMESFGDCYYVLIIIGFLLCQTSSSKKNASFKKIKSKIKADLNALKLNRGTLASIMIISFIVNNVI